MGRSREGGGSSVFEPLVRGGSFNFQLPLKGGSSCSFYGKWHTPDTIENKGNSFQTIVASDTQTPTHGLACTQPYHPGSSSHGQLFLPY